MLRLWRGRRALRLGPRRLRHRHARHRRRLAGAARHRLRARDHARRRHLGRADLLRRRRHQRRRRRRGLRLRRQLRGARRLLLPEQPVGHLRAGPPAVARLHRPAGPGVRHPRASRSTATTCWPSSPPPGSRWPAPRRPGPDAHRGRDLPHGPAHDVGRPHPLPLAADEEEWRVKDPLARLRALLRAEGLADDGFDERGRGRGGRGGRRAAPGLPGHARPRDRPTCSPTSTPSRTRCCRRSGAYAAYLAEFDEDA